MTAQPWMDKSRSPDERAALLIEQLTLDEMISLVHGPMPTLLENPPADAAMGAGYIPGVARLGIPALNETDASLGVANPRKIRPGDGATALPLGWPWPPPGTRSWPMRPGPWSARRRATRASTCCWAAAPT